MSASLSSAWRATPLDFYIFYMIHLCISMLLVIMKQLVYPSKPCVAFLVKTTLSWLCGVWYKNQSSTVAIYCADWIGNLATRKTSAWFHFGGSIQRVKLPEVILTGMHGNGIWKHLSGLLLLLFVDLYNPSGNSKTSTLRETSWTLQQADAKRVLWRALV